MNGMITGSEQSLHHTLEQLSKTCCADCGSIRLTAARSKPLEKAAPPLEASSAIKQR